MGWIAALKQGAPAETTTETLNADGAADPDIPVTLVDESGNTVSLTLAAPSGAAGPGYIKTFIRLTAAYDVDVIVDSGVRRDADAGGKAILANAGGVARYIWDGSKWSLIPGADSAATFDLDIASA